MVRCATSLLFTILFFVGGHTENSTLLSKENANFETIIPKEELSLLSEEREVGARLLNSEEEGAEEGTEEEEDTEEDTHEEEEDAEEEHEEGEDAEEEIEEEEDFVYAAFFFFLLAVLLGLGTLQLLTKTGIPIPYTVLVFLEGLFLGLLHNAGFDMGQLGDSIHMWENVDADLLLVAFLPALIFGDTFKCSWQLFRTALPQCMLLAFPGIALGSFLGMGVFYWVLPYNWNLSTSLCFASILGATDPVAVVGLLGSLGCSERLQMQISGESLLNDGSAMVIFYIALDLMIGESYSAEGVIELFCRLAMGGMVLGFAIGVLATLVLLVCSKRENEIDAKTQLILTVVVAYGAFYFATHAISHVSEVLTTVFASIIMARSAWPLIVEKEGVILFWEMFCYLAETLIFFLAGTILSMIFYDEEHPVNGADWGWLFVVYIIAALVRLVMLVVLFPLLSYTGFGTNWKDLLVMWWGGLRGAVGLALALMVMRTSGVDTDTGHLFVFHVGGSAMLTLVINATTCSYLVKFLGLAGKGDAYDATMKQFERQMHIHVYREFKRIQQVPRFVAANIEKVKEIVKALQDDTVSEEVEQQIKQDIKSRMSSEFPRTSVDAEPIDLNAEELSDNMLFATRNMFYKMVRHEYWTMIDDDLLPAGAKACTVLLESVDTADALDSEPISDFQALLKHVSCGYKSSWFLGKMLRIWRDFVNGTGIGSDVVPIRREGVKFDVYALLCCMDAHTMAENTLRKLHFTKDDDLWKAHQKVISESVEQNEQIKVFLQANHVDEEAISVCRTKMMVLYLLKKKESIVKSWVHSGILCEADVELLLEESGHEMAKALELQPSTVMSQQSLDLSQNETRSSRSSAKHGNHRLQMYGNVKLSQGKKA